MSVQKSNVFSIGCHFEGTDILETASTFRLNSEPAQQVLIYKGFSGFGGDGNFRASLLAKHG
jgi:hypothetical protein